jgi:hypothetical protein
MKHKSYQHMLCGPLSLRDIYMTLRHDTGRDILEIETEKANNTDTERMFNGTSRVGLLREYKANDQNVTVVRIKNTVFTMPKISSGDNSQGRKFRMGTKLSAEVTKLSELTQPSRTHTGRLK